MLMTYSNYNKLEFENVAHNLVLVLVLVILNQIFSFSLTLLYTSQKMLRKWIQKKIAFWHPNIYKGNILPSPHKTAAHSFKTMPIFLYHYINQISVPYAFDTAWGKVKKIMVLAVNSLSFQN